MSNSEITEAVALAIARGCNLDPDAASPKASKAGHTIPEWLYFVPAATAAIAAMRAASPTADGGISKIAARDVSGNLLVCTGCHSSEDLPSMRSRRPGTISCCPERKMVTVDELLRLATLPTPAKDAEVERLREALYEIADICDDEDAYPRMARMDVLKAANAALSSRINPNDQG